MFYERGDSDTILVNQGLEGVEWLIRKTTAGSKSLPTAGSRGKCWIFWRKTKIHFIWKKPGQVENEFCTQNYGNHRESGCAILNRFPTESRGKEPPEEEWKWETLGQSGERNCQIYAHENNTEWSSSEELWCRLLTGDLLFWREFCR